MSSLFKWQSISFISRFFATIVGLAQSILIVRFLTPAEYGIVGIINAIGNLTGVLKHMGLVSATVRELAHADNDEDAAKVFSSAVLVRSVVSIPLVLGLFFLAEYLAVNIYHQPTIALPIRIFAGVLLLQSFQELANAVLAGRQQFKALFSFQAAIAIVSFALYVPLVYYFKINGYFWALLGLTVISSAALVILSLRTFSWRLTLPRGAELRHFVSSLLGLGLILYLGKIMYMVWQKMGTLYLGATVLAEAVGYFSFAELYATKIMIISDAVTDVNLPALTSHLRRSISEFRQKFLGNFEKVYALMILAGVSAIFWAKDLFHLVVGTKYDSSLYLVLPLILAFFLYGLLNLLESSVLVPMKFRKELLVYHLIMLLGTGTVIGLALARHWDPLLSVSWAMAMGSLGALAYLSWVCSCKELPLWRYKTLLPTLVGVPVLVAHFALVDLVPRVAIYAAFLGFYYWLVPKLGILDWRRFVLPRLRRGS